MSEISFYASQIFDGIAFGGIYGIFALSIVILYRSNKLFNLAQTEMATLSAIVMFFLLKQFSFGSALFLTLVASFIFGLVLHFTIMRFLTERRQNMHSSQTIITIGFFSIFNSLSSYILGDEPQPFPSPFGTDSFQILGVNITFLSLGILVITAGLVGVIYICFKFTRIGLIFEAVAENDSAAKLRGINVSNILAIAWGLTLVAGATGAIFIAPALYLSPSMLSSIFAYALIAVVIGGLESPLGAFLGGLLVGIIENLASNFKFIGTELKFVAVVAVLIFILIVRPRGIWGRKETRKV